MEIWNVTELFYMKIIIDGKFLFKRKGDERKLSSLFY